MKKRTVSLLVLSLVVTLTVSALGIAILLTVSPKTTSVEIEVTLAKSVTQTIGNVEYTFKLYPYDQAGIYLLRVERKDEFKTRAVAMGHTYQFLDLEVYVKKLISAGILIKASKI